MKLLIVIFLALAFKSCAKTYGDSSDEHINQKNIYNTRKEWRDLFKATTMKPDSQWQSSASSLLGANSYKIKVTKRIENSHILRDMPHIQEEIYKLADKKLEKCVTPLRQELDRSCVGRVTGQIMQLISAAENSSRYTAQTGNKRREE